jgi:hypothetical protein
MAVFHCSTKKLACSIIWKLIRSQRKSMLNPVLIGILFLFNLYQQIRGPSGSSVTGIVSANAYPCLPETPPTPTSAPTAIPSTTGLCKRLTMCLTGAANQSRSHYYSKLTSTDDVVVSIYAHFSIHTFVTKGIPQRRSHMSYDSTRLVWFFQIFYFFRSQLNVHCRLGKVKKDDARHE